MGKRRRVHQRVLAPAAATKHGAPPGSPIYVGEPSNERVRLGVIDFDASRCTEQVDVSPAELAQFKAIDTTTWVNVDGIHNVDIVRTVCQQFGVHPLAMEDVLHPGIRPQMTDYGNNVFVLAHMVRATNAPTGSLFESEQVSMVLGAGWLMTFQQRSGDLFDPIRRRLHTVGSRIRSQAADFVMHAVLDAIVDGYFTVIERFEERIGAIEDQAFVGVGADIPRAVHTLKTDIASFRRLVWPLREVLGALLKSEGELIQPATIPFLRDVNDHEVQVIDMLDGFHARLSAILDLYLALTSNRTNEVMRVLTIMSTVFIPLTFIAGVYGMNFQYMPELGLRYAYPVVLGVMLLIGVGMGWWLYRRGWLFPPEG